jgi:hypothetical protein
MDLRESMRVLYECQRRLMEDEESRKVPGAEGRSFLRQRAVTHIAVAIEYLREAAIDYEGNSGQ